MPAVAKHEQSSCVWSAVLNKLFDSKYSIYSNVEMMMQWNICICENEDKWTKTWRLYSFLSLW